jgi:hypothetical protein
VKIKQLAMICFVFLVFVSASGGVVKYAGGNLKSDGEKCEQFGSGEQ